MKSSGKKCLKIILKDTKKTRFHFLFRRYIFRKTTGRGGGIKLIPPPSAVLGLTNSSSSFSFLVLISLSLILFDLIL